MNKYTTDANINVSEMSAVYQSENKADIQSESESGITADIDVAGYGVRDSANGTNISRRQWRINMEKNNKDYSDREAFKMKILKEAVEKMKQKYPEDNMKKEQNDKEK